MNRKQPAVDQNWEELYDDHAKALTLFARQWLPSISDAEDCVQDAFIRLLKSPKQFTEKPVPILYQAVKWAALDRVRSSQRRVRREQASSADAEQISLFEDRLEKRERRETIEAALQQLPDEQREVLTMHIWGERPFREIGETLGIPLNTAASRYRYALKKLGQILEAKELTA
ncbi:MAG: RNA polymerase sigma-70 factor (ECF subfamily) [Verrucomicrobiales bacterium]|jgi:RNA polymerase sigma-70 factor (ECF subfamily)